MPSFPCRPFPQIHESGLGQPVGMVPTDVIARRLFPDDSDEENLECLMVQFNTGASVTGTSVTGASFEGASVTGASVTGASVAGASITGASITGASVTGASVTGASVAGASFTGASVTGASFAETPFEQEYVEQVFYEGGVFPASKKIDGHRIAKSVPDSVITDLKRNGDGPWKCVHCRLLGTIDGIFYSPCFQCAIWGWRYKGVPYFPDDSRTANNTYLQGMNLTVRQNDITTSD